MNEKDRMFKIESKIKQALKDDKTKRESRNRQVSYVFDEKVEVKIGVVGKRRVTHDLDTDWAGKSIEDIDVYGASVTFNTSDGTCVMNFQGENKNSADRLVRTFLDKIGVRYRISRGQ